MKIRKIHSTFDPSLLDWYESESRRAYGIVRDMTDSFQRLRSELLVAEDNVSPRTADEYWGELRYIPGKEGKLTRDWERRLEEIKLLQFRIRQANDRRREASDKAAAAGALFRNIEEYVKDKKLTPDVHAAHRSYRRLPVINEPIDRTGIDDGLAVLRARIVELKKAADDIESAPVSRAEAVARLDSYMSLHSENIRVSVGDLILPDADRSANLIYSIRSDFPKDLLFALCADSIRSLIEKHMAQAYEKLPPGLSFGERQKKLQEISDELLALEVQEEILICRSEASKYAVQRRPDADPRALLHLVDECELLASGIGIALPGMIRCSAEGVVNDEA